VGFKPQRGRHHNLINTPLIPSSLQFKISSSPQTFDVPMSYQMTMTVSKDDIAILKRYSSDKEGSIQDVSDVLGHMVKQVSMLEQEYQEPLFNMELFYVNSQQIVLVLQVMLL
jgi:hypothetical protein